MFELKIIDIPLYETKFVNTEMWMIHSMNNLFCAVTK